MNGSGDTPYFEGSTAFLRGEPVQKEEDRSGYQRRDYTLELKILEEMLKECQEPLSREQISTRLGFPPRTLVTNNFMKNFIAAATHALLIWEDDEGCIGALT